MARTVFSPMCCCTSTTSSAPLRRRIDIASWMPGRRRSSPRSGKCTSITGPMICEMYPSICAIYKQPVNPIKSQVVRSRVHPADGSLISRSTKLTNSVGEKAPQPHRKCSFCPQRKLRAGQQPARKRHTACKNTKDTANRTPFGLFLRRIQQSFCCSDRVLPEKTPERPSEKGAQRAGTVTGRRKRRADQERLR